MGLNSELLNHHPVPAALPALLRYLPALPAPAPCPSRSDDMGKAKKKVADRASRAKTQVKAEAKQSSQAKRDAASDDTPAKVWRDEKWANENAPSTKDQKRAAYKELKNKKPKGFKPARIARTFGSA